MGALRIITTATCGELEAFGDSWDDGWVSNATRWEQSGGGVRIGGRK